MKESRNNLIKELEKQLKEEIASVDYYQTQLKTHEKKVLDLKELIAELEGMDK